MFASQPLCTLCLMSALFVAASGDALAQIQAEAEAGAEAGAGAGAEILQVKYISNTPNSKETYVLALLEAALKRTIDSHGPFLLDFRETDFSADRKLHLLVEGEQVNVAWLPLDANPSPRSKLLQVPIPILRGLLGYRIAIIRTNAPDIMRNVNTLDDLKALRLGQGKGWADNTIYAHNGIPVIESLNKYTLLRMLSGGRYDLVPLGITEVHEGYTLDDGGADNLMADPHVLIYYPFPAYFYVSQHSPQLAERLTHGLQQMVDDGSLIQLFNAHFSDHLAKLNLPGRQLIKLHHTYFEASLDRVDPRLLLDPLEAP